MTHGALALSRRGHHLARRCGVDYVRLTVPQETVLQDDRPIVLWRDGNRLGKSYAAAYDIITRCRGTHPFQQTHRPPIRVLCISYSLTQMADLMEMLWVLIPKNEIDPRNGHEPGRGITGKPPRLVFTSGPGRGSRVVFATYKQGARRIMGGKYHLVVLDEPPPERVFGEVAPRVLDSRGHIRIYMTPTPDAPPLRWLRDRVETDDPLLHIPEHNYHLKAEHLWPRGFPGPWNTQAEIDVYEAGLLDVERAMRMTGAWDPVILGAWIRAYDEACVSVARPSVGSWLIVGVDHGADAGKQAAMLVAVSGRGAKRPKVWWIDEMTTEGFTTPEHDAKGILDMLRRNGFKYDDIDDWVGDRPTGSARQAIRKSNTDLRRELAWQLDRPVRETKVIHPAKKWGGSMMDGVRMVNALFADRDSRGVPSGLVHPQCTEFRAACSQFDGDSRHPLKDVLDAGRYAMERALLVQPRTRLIARY